MKKQEYIQCIILLLQSLHQKNPNRLSEISFEDTFKKQTQHDGMFECKYILNQMLRLYVLPLQNYHISQKAKDLWSQLTDKNVGYYRYKEKIKCNNLTNKLTVDTCLGNSKKIQPTQITPNDVIPFNKVFITEHIVPISYIIEKLFELGQNPTSSDVESILNSIHVAVLLKTENKTLSTKRNIGNNVPPDLWWKKMVDTYYTPNQIVLDNIW